MIGALPKKLKINNVDYAIDSDFRTALLIFEMFESTSKNMTPLNKQLAMFEILYMGIIPDNVEEAQKQALWFLNVGQESKKKQPKTLDYKQDEQLIFSAVNAVYTKEVRAEKYMHWWTFYGLCQAINPESLISNVISIRLKKATGKKLEKHEKQFYNENKDLIDFDDLNFDYDEMAKVLRGG